jgi:hypothetical protein
VLLYCLITITFVFISGFFDDILLCNVLSIAMAKVSVCHKDGHCKLGDSYRCHQWLIWKLISSSFRKTKVGHQGVTPKSPNFWGEWGVPAKNPKFRVHFFNL